MTPVELNKYFINDEVLTSYSTGGNLIIHLKSSFDNKVNIEDVLFDVILKQFQLQNKSIDGMQNNGQLHTKNI